MTRWAALVQAVSELAGTFRWPSKLEWRIARRYLRSRRGARTASLNTVISTGGVAVGVTALIVVLGVMNGLRNDLRERILVANPHLRVLTYGAASCQMFLSSTARGCASWRTTRFDRRRSWRWS